MDYLRHSLAGTECAPKEKNKRPSQSSAGCVVSVSWQIDVLSYRERGWNKNQNTHILPSLTAVAKPINLRDCRSIKMLSDWNGRVSATDWQMDLAGSRYIQTLMKFTIKNSCSWLGKYFQCTEAKLLSPLISFLGNAAHRWVNDLTSISSVLMFASNPVRDVTDGWFISSIWS